MSDQAETQSPSIEDRVAAQFSPSEDQPVEQSNQQAEEGTEPTFEEVEYEGERFQVPPKLKKGLMLNEDYTRKTQELAEQRNTVEITQKQLRLVQEQTRFRDEIKDDVSLLANIEAYLKQPVDWNNLTVEDMLRKRGELDQLKDRRAQLQETLSQKEKDFMSKLQGQHQELLKEVNATLAKQIKGWGPEVSKGVSDWAKSQGFTQEELNSITNPVHALTLYKAAQYDKLVAQKDSAVAQAAKAQPMGKPGSSNPMPQEVKNKLAFQKQLQKTKGDPVAQKRLVEDRLASIFSR